MKRFRFLARADWALLVALTFPIQIVLPIACLFEAGCNVAAVATSNAIEALLLIAIMVGLAVLVDRMRFALRTEPRPLSLAEHAALHKALHSAGVREADALLALLRVVASDFSMGAHVRGVLRPRIIVSAGLFVGLLRKDPTAIAILAHERAHVAHFDQLLPGMLGMTLLEVGGRLVRMVGDMSGTAADGSSATWLPVVVLPVAAVLIYVVSQVSKYREFYADAEGVASTGNPTAYGQLLEKVAGTESRKASFFHPSIEARRQQLCNGWPVLRKARFWKVYWTLVLATSWWQWWMVRLYDQANPTQLQHYAGCGAVVAIVCLLFEVTRGWWAPPVGEVPLAMAQAAKR